LEDEGDVVFGAGDRGGVAGDEELPARASSLVAQAELRAGDARDLVLRGAALRLSERGCDGGRMRLMRERSRRGGRANENDERTKRNETNDEATNEK
jgi:hypothetical protein